MREKPRSWMSLIASGGEAVSGSIVTSTSGTITSRTTVSPRSKMLSISSASCVVTSASPGSSWSSAFSSSRETKARWSACWAPTRRSVTATTRFAKATKGMSATEVHVRGR